jgi:hypothetical protein
VTRNHCDVSRLRSHILTPSDRSGHLQTRVLRQGYGTKKPEGFLADRPVSELSGTGLGRVEVHHPAPVVLLSDFFIFLVSSEDWSTSSHLSGKATSQDLVCGNLRKEKTELFSFCETALFSPSLLIQNLSLVDEIPADQNDLARIGVEGQAILSPPDEANRIAVHI